VIYPARAPESGETIDDATSTVPPRHTPEELAAIRQAIEPKAPWPKNSPIQGLSSSAAGLKLVPFSVDSSPMNSEQPAPSGLSVLTFINGKFKAKAKRTHIIVQVDETRHEVPFGESFVPVSPGVHQVNVWWAHARGATATVTVPAGELIRLRFDLPAFVWQTAKLTPVES
jgi:hypothetical protein